VTAYAARRQDGLWSLLMINKDPKRSFATKLIVRNTLTGELAGLRGTLDLYQYSSQQYLLGGSPNDPYPVRAEEPDHKVIQLSNSGQPQISLPPYSLTVVRGGPGTLSGMR